MQRLQTGTQPGYGSCYLISLIFRKVSSIFRVSRVGLYFSLDFRSVGNYFRISTEFLLFNLGLKFQLHFRDIEVFIHDRYCPTRFVFFLDIYYSLANGFACFVFTELMGRIACHKSSYLLCPRTLLNNPHKEL